MLPQISCHDLDGRPRRHGKQGADKAAEDRADDAAERGADEDRDEHPERVEPDRAAHHDRIEDVVLDLLVDEEDDEGDDARRQRVEQGDDHRRDTGEQAADERQEVDDGYPDAEYERVGHPRQVQGDGDDDAGDERGGEVARHVADDRVLDVVHDVAYPCGPLRLHPVDDPGVDPRGVDQQEEREEEDRHETDDGRQHAPTDVQRRATESGDDVLRPSVLRRHVLEEVELLHEVTDRPPALFGLADDRRQLGGEVLSGVDDGRQDDKEQRRDGEHPEAEDEAGREAPRQASSLEKADERVEQQGEEERDRDQQQERPHLPGHDGPEQRDDDDRVDDEGGTQHPALELAPCCPLWIGREARDLVTLAGRRARNPRLGHHTSQADNGPTVVQLRPR